ncbi:MAG: threonylcarbamoyl-AMP synthase [Euryarchaeota archaeon]|nr:threonylcarbamoyl-AMP synthase [Euryarchaeota archaeon]
MPRLINNVQSAAAAIRAGGVVVYPTETVYGIGALALNEKTVRKVIALKRIPSKPISMAVSSLEMIDTVAYIHDDDLLHKLLPGPFTVLLPKKDVVPLILTAGSLCVGIRYPAHDMACQLINEVGEPITSTSANLTGDPPATRAEDVILDVDCILEGGTASLGPSTVVDLVNHTVIRRGAGYESIERAGLLHKSWRDR